MAELFLRFDIVGPMAHFRKFYSNSSSLSYSVPPRTVLMGIVAAVLGYDLDVYCEKLSVQQARIGVALQGSVRSIMQTVNYLATDENDWHGVKQRTQIPVELVLPPRGRTCLRYRVYFQHYDDALTERLYNQLMRREYCYPISLGLAGCLAWAEEPHLYKLDEVYRVQDPQGPLEIRTVTPVLRLVEFPPLEQLKGNQIRRDTMPLDLDAMRQPKPPLGTITVLWEANGHPLPLHIRGEIFRLPDQEYYGCFLEV